MLWWGEKKRQSSHFCFCFFQPETPEYRAACKLWDLYIRTKNEFVQRGDYDEDDDDGDDTRETPAGAMEDEARVDREYSQTVFVMMWINRCYASSRNKLSWFVPQAAASLKEVLEQLLDTVLRHTEHGRLVSELFQRLPSKIVGVKHNITQH